jgi:type II secretory pathway pseudopilin PulG
MTPKIKQSGGFSLIELVIVVAVIMIVAAIAVPNLLGSRRASNEASALSALRVMSEAQAAYYGSIGGGNYGTANDLYTAHLIDPTVAAANNLEVGGNPPRNTAKGGYRFRVQTTPANPSTGASSTYVISAIPSSTSGVTQTGANRLCLREDAMLRGSGQNLDSHYNYPQCGFANPFTP